MSDEIIKHTQPSAIDVHIDDNRRLGVGMVESLRRNPEATGERIFDLATARAEKWFAEEVLRQAEEFVKHLNQLLINAEKCAAEIKLTERRLGAIKRGEFKIGWNGRIEFTDAELRFG